MHHSRLVHHSRRLVVHHSRRGLVHLSWRLVQRQLSSLLLLKKGRRRPTKAVVIEEDGPPSHFPDRRQPWWLIPTLIQSPLVHRPTTPRCDPCSRLLCWIKRMDWVVVNTNRSSTIWCLQIQPHPASSTPHPKLKMTSMTTPTPTTNDWHQPLSLLLQSISIHICRASSNSQLVV
jgi:hypothetical protein